MMNRFHAALSGLLIAVSAPAIAASPIDGTWKIDMASAKVSTKPDMWTIKDGMYDCTSCTPAYKIAADGKPHPVAGRDYWDAAAVSILDANTIEMTRYRKGAPIGMTRVAASPDGGMVTFTSTSADNAKGAALTNTSMAKRVGTAMAGMHATSGSWVAVNEGAKIADENLTATMSMVGDMVTLSLPTGEHYTAKLDGPQVPLMGDKAGSMVSLKRAGAGFIETDYANGKANTTFTYTPVDATTMTLKVVNLRNNATDEYTLTKQ